MVFVLWYKKAKFFIFLFLATNPKVKAERVMNEDNKKKQKQKDGGFKLAPDGRLIIKDSDNESEDESVGKKFKVPGLSDSGEYVHYSFFFLSTGTTLLNVLHIPIFFCF